MSTIIKIDKVSKAFLRRVILKDVSLSVEAGHTVGIVGSNGSGKSVLFQIICGFLVPDTHILLENVPGLAPTSLLLLEQLRTIDRKRLRGYIGRISKEKMLEVDAALAISIGIGYPNERRTHNV